MKQEQLKRRILKHVGTREYEPKEVDSLARVLGVAKAEYGDYHEAVKALMKTGRLVMGSSSALTLPEPSGTIVGNFRSNPRGFGFVIPDQANSHGDLYIPEGRAKGAVTGDTVEARVHKKGKRGGKMIFEGSIVRIIERGRSQFVGALCLEMGRWFVRPDGNTLHVPIFIADHKAKEADEGDQVVVEIVQYPDGDKSARGVIVKVLGKEGGPGVDTLSIIHQHGLPEEFPAKVLSDARKVIGGYDPEREAADRDDLRKLTIITIDPDDARDFDDAISIEETKDGLELGVHIADVAHFVRVGGALDDEARKRANSVYFPRHVIPMLPEVLSNGICSLQEGEPRLTKSAFITYDKNGKRKSTRFANTVIRSAKRLTYDQATQIIEGKKGRFGAKIVGLVKQMENLAKRIQKRRIRDGMLVLDLPGVELLFDEQGLPTGVEPTDTSFSHTLIEMFMVEANEVVAEKLTEIGVPHLRRVHPAPEPNAVEPLGRFLTALDLTPIKSMDRNALQGILKKVIGTDASYAVNMAILRSMQQAKYMPDLDGHFALASKHYSHFTSPIRRYPDLTVHRLLDAHLRGKLKKRGKQFAKVPALAECEEMGQHCSETERKAESAERELRLIYVLRLLSKHPGSEHDGVITGVTNFGLFVQLAEYLVEGLIRFQDMVDDWWEVDAGAGCVVGERTGKKYKIGDRLRVAVAGIDISDRKLDLVPIGDGPTRRGKRSTDRRGKPGQGKSQRNSKSAKSAKSAKSSKGQKPGKRSKKRTKTKGSKSGRSKRP